jgi:hypothetical protein
MKESQILDELEAICNKLGIELRYEKGNFEGGFCRLKDKNVIIVNKTLTNQQKIRVLARELALFDLEGIYIVPALRSIIDEYRESGIDQRKIETLGEVNEGNGTS